jgi:hypothetical protein
MKIRTAIAIAGLTLLAINLIAGVSMLAVWIIATYAAHLPVRDYVGRRTGFARVDLIEPTETVETAEIGD